MSNSGKCWYCGVSLTLGANADRKTLFAIDHVVAKKHGSGNDRENLVPCCGSCNSAKRTKSVEEFRQYMAWKSSGCEPLTERQLRYLESIGIDTVNVIPERYVFDGEC